MDLVLLDDLDGHVAPLLVYNGPANRFLAEPPILTPSCLRPLRAADMPALADLQLVAYQPLYHEEQAVLETRFAAAPGLCFGAYEGEELLAYILSHPWPAASPPAIGVPLQPPAPGLDNWFIHDLAIGPKARGLGLGRALARTAMQAAREAGLVRGDLVAVQGAWSFWEKIGYRVASDLSPNLAAKVAAYGPDAHYMTIDLTAPVAQT
jgi:ribosomal protein S18 acetylase RimI-like enzyme